MLAPSRCERRNCKHLRGWKQPDGTEESEVVVCAAYPNGIPPEIAYGEDLHLKVREDQDNELVYEKYEE